MRNKLLLISILFLGACASGGVPSGSLASVRDGEAQKEYLRCMDYMAKREKQLVYPNPWEYCLAVRRAIKADRHVGDWAI